MAFFYQKDEINCKLYLRLRVERIVEDHKETATLFSIPLTHFAYHYFAECGLYTCQSASLMCVSHDESQRERRNIWGNG